MTPRRRETSSREMVQPVGLYKSIAVTFLGLTVLLLVVILFISSKRATITIETRSEPVNIRSSVVVSPSSEDEPPFRARFVTTTVSLSQSFLPTGVSEEDGVATGMATISNTSAVAQALIATTRLVTSDGVVFRIKKAVTVPARGSVEAEVYADAPGRQGNIPASDFSIPGLSNERQKAVSAKSTNPMSGGVKRTGKRSDDDIASAKAVVQEALLAKGEAEIVQQFPGQKGVFTMMNEIFEERFSTEGAAGAYIVSGQADIVGVIYDVADVTVYAKDLLVEKSETGGSYIRMSKTEPVVSLLTHRKEKNEIELEVVVDGLATIHPDNPAIQKTEFFGKTKDEVRRYTLSIDRVRGVNVQFSPSWMLTVPHASDRVDVIVTEVE